MTRTKHRVGKKNLKVLRADQTISKLPNPTVFPKALLAQAAQSLQVGDVDSALPLAKRALELYEPGSIESLPALNICGEIHIERGDIDSARQCFQKAVAIDTKGMISEEDGGGPEKFLWLAQISEHGGMDSVNWFEKGSVILRQQIQSLLEHESQMKGEQSPRSLLTEKVKKLADVLCSVVEVYMTDLSWEEDAEQKCESLITEATLVAPDFAEPWQTLANIRLSQQRLDDARVALKRSLDIWRELPSQDPKVPDYSTRVSLARLLMEADMDLDAIDILEHLVEEDDRSVEVWYLGGWALYILGEKRRDNECKNEENVNSLDWKKSWILSQRWLKNAMKLFEEQNYEDERLGEHARQLLKTLDSHNGQEAADVEEENEDEWSEIEENEDDELITDA